MMLPECIICKGQINSFRDELSIREYKISGMCQDCQDETFCDLLAGKKICHKPCHEEAIETFLEKE